MTDWHPSACFVGSNQILSKSALLEGQLFHFDLAMHDEISCAKEQHGLWMVWHTPQFSQSLWSSGLPEAILLLTTGLECKWKAKKRHFVFSITYCSCCSCLESCVRCGGNQFSPCNTRKAAKLTQRLPFWNIILTRTMWQKRDILALNIWEKGKNWHASPASNNYCNWSDVAESSCKHGWLIQSGGVHSAILASWQLIRSNVKNSKHANFVFLLQNHFWG